MRCELRRFGLTAAALVLALTAFGCGGAEEIAVEAFSASARVANVEPKDPSLRQAQKYLDAMFTEYGEAVTLHAEGTDSGEHMYRAYGLANFARDVLAEAQPALQHAGCDVSPLLERIPPPPASLTAAPA